jgi:hypothetical protein
MFRDRLYYPNYNNPYGYINCNSRHFNTAFTPLPTVVFKDGNYISTYPFTEAEEIKNEEIKDSENIINKNINVEEDEEKDEKKDEKKDNKDENKAQKQSNRSKEGVRLGPICFSENTLSLFGFSIALDDLIIIVLIILLLLDSNCDYLLLIVLGLILFNINLGDFNLF